MAIQIEQAMRECRNFFEKGSQTGQFAITEGRLLPSVSSPYVFISGSSRNDGVHECVDGYLPNSTDEVFEGRVWFLYPPLAFLSLCKQMSEYDDKQPVGAMASESFSGYSYNRGTVKSWQEAYFLQLAVFRHMYTEVG